MPSAGLFRLLIMDEKPRSYTVLSAIGAVDPKVFSSMTALAGIDAKTTALTRAALGVNQNAFSSMTPLAAIDAKKLFGATTLTGMDVKSMSLGVGPKTLSSMSALSRTSAKMLAATRAMALDPKILSSMTALAGIDAKTTALARSALGIEPYRFPLTKMALGIDPKTILGAAAITPSALRPFSPPTMTDDDWELLPDLDELSPSQRRVLELELAVLIVAVLSFAEFFTQDRRIELAGDCLMLVAALRAVYWRLTGKLDA
jgi:hypothetical protein